MKFTFLTRLLLAAALVAAGSITMTMTPVYAGGAMEESVDIIKVTTKESSVVFTVCEREPFDKSHYSVTAFRSMPPKLHIQKTSAPRSNFDEPRLIDLEYSFDELGVGPGQQFHLVNTIGLPSC